VGGIDLDLRSKILEALTLELPNLADAVQLGLVPSCLFVGERRGGGSGVGRVALSWG